MKKRISMLFIAQLSIVLFSCKKDILNSVPLDKYSDANVWQDITLVNLYVNGIYASLTTEYSRAISLMQANVTDESKNNRTGINADLVAKGQYTSSNSPYNSFWNSNFAAIRLCNVFLEKINNVPGDTLLKNRLTGEVVFLRVFFYHELYNLFGRFPIITKSLTATEDGLYTARGSDEDCIKFMTSQLDTAANLLPLKYTGQDIGRITKGACWALKCRILLYAGMWQEASIAAEQVIKLKIYTLFPDYAGIFYPTNENNSEVIFDRQYIGVVSTGPTTSIDALNAPPNYTGFQSGVNDPTQNIVDQYEMRDGSPFDWTNPNHKARPYYNRDPRMDASIIHDSTVWQGRIVDMKKGSTSNPLTSPSATGYYMKKFLDPNFQYANRSVVGNAQNFIYIRYAEILLNYAEAQFKLGNKEVAREYVNMVRARPSVNMPPISSANFTWDSYMHERQIELAFEGTRLWDIRRWRIGPQTLGALIYGINIDDGVGGTRTYTKVPVETRNFINPTMYLFPIPQSEVDKYPNRTLEQNPGW